MPVHTIRLAGPWELHVNGSEPVRVTLPFELQVEKISCWLVRNFHRPTGLTDQSQVCIIVTTHDTSPTVCINEKRTLPSKVSQNGQVCESSYDITPLLNSFNSLAVQPAANAILNIQSAVMEIHERSPDSETQSAV